MELYSGDDSTDDSQHLNTLDNSYTKPNIHTEIFDVELSSEKETAELKNGKKSFPEAPDSSKPGIDKHDCSSSDTSSSDESSSTEGSDSEKENLNHQSSNLGISASLPQQEFSKESEISESSSSEESETESENIQQQQYQLSDLEETASLSLQKHPENTATFSDSSSDEESGMEHNISDNYNHQPPDLGTEMELPEQKQSKDANTTGESFSSEENQPENENIHHDNQPPETIPMQKSFEVSKTFPESSGEESDSDNEKHDHQSEAFRHDTNVISAEQKFLDDNPANKDDQTPTADQPAVPNSGQYQDDVLSLFSFPDENQAASSEEGSSTDNESTSSKESEDALDESPINQDDSEENQDSEDDIANENLHRLQDNNIQVYDIDEITDFEDEIAADHTESLSHCSANNDEQENTETGTTEEIPSSDEEPSLNFRNESSEVKPDVQENVAINNSSTLTNETFKETGLEEENLSLQPKEESNQLENKKSISPEPLIKDNDSSSSSDNEDTNFLDAFQEAHSPPAENSEKEAIVQPLKRASEERDKHQNSDRFSRNGYNDDYRYSADIDDASLRARTAKDFESEPGPPALPPKLSLPPALPPKAKNKNYFSAKHKTSYPHRGRQSDDENYDEFALPAAHQRKPLHPPPDRVIDFSRTPKQNRKSRGSDVQRRHRDPFNRVIDIPSRPSEDINDIFKRQAMVSLHSSSTYPSQDADTFDTMQEDDQDLNKLIQEANNLDIPHQSILNKSSVDVLFPSYQRNESPPQTVNLTSSYPEAFAKLAPPSEPVIVSPVNDEKQRAVSQGPYNEFTTNSILSRKRKSERENAFSTSLGLLDGDDEGSLAETDFSFAVPPVKSTKSVDARQPSYFGEVFPSDYTDFDTESEFDDRPRGRSLPARAQNNDITPYDTDVDLPGKEKRLNPIVNEDYQICSPLKKSHNTFPKRIKFDKPKPKQRSGLDVIAVALTDPSTNAVQPMSLPYREPEPLKRHKSIPALKSDSGPVSFFGQVPHLVVARDGKKRDAPSTYDGPKSLPIRKKSRAKAENAAPKIHLSLSSTNQAGGELNSANSNNLQINLLPSDDPNVINLNISTTPKHEAILVKRDAATPVSETVDSSPLSLQPVGPITAISHKHNADSEVSETVAPDTQHRVVEVDPVNIETAPVNPEPLPVSFAEPQVPIISVVDQQIMTQQVTEPVQPFSQLVPVTTQPAVPVVAQPQNVIAPLTSQTSPTIVTQQPIVTQETRVFDNSNTIRSQPSNVVVEIPHPWEEKSRTLPSDGRMLENRMRHGGDSGIDLASYGKKSRRKRRASSSTDESDYDRKKRSSSKRKLKNNMDASSNPGLSDQYIEWYRRKYLKPTCCYMFLKHFIFALNLLFGIVGLGLIGLGIWGFADLSSYGLSNPTMVLRDPVFPIFVIGIVMTLTCLEGAIGFFRDNICMIKFFGWCLVLLCLVFISGGIAFWILKDSTITPFVFNNFMDMIRNYNTTSKKVASFTIDQIQINFECCGITGYTEWNMLEQFPCSDGRCSVPQSCCRSTAVPCSRSEAEGPRIEEACKETMTLWLKNNIAILVGLWLAIICLFIINFISIHFMIREILYLQQINEKIHSLIDPPQSIDDVTSSSDDVTSDSEYEERRRRRRRRKKRRERKRKSHYRNRAYS